MNRPDFIDFILKDIHSKALKDYLKEIEDTLEEITKVVNNEKVSGIEAKLIIKDILNKGE